MNLGVLIEGLKARVAAGPRAESVRICDITDDSRTVVPGSLFIARAGTKVDGRKFIPDALAAGAVAVLTDDPGVSIAPRTTLVLADDVPIISAQIAERFYGSPSSKLDLIGVTGTNGKTTTAHLIHQILNGTGVRCGLIGTVDGVWATSARWNGMPGRFTIAAIQGSGFAPRRRGRDGCGPERCSPCKSRTMSAGRSGSSAG